MAEKYLRLEISKDFAIMHFSIDRVRYSMSEIALLAEARKDLGTGPSRELRRNGMIPATIYGAGKKPVSISVQEKEVTKLYRKHGFTSTVIEIELEGKKHKVLPKAVDLHPITDIVFHADFVFLNDKVQKVDVPIVFEGKERSVGVKRGGFFNIIMRKMPLLCNIGSIPTNITIDVTEMLVGASIRSEDITLPEGCSFISKKDFVVASITGRGGKADASDDAAYGGAEGEESAGEESSDS